MSQLSSVVEIRLFARARELAGASCVQLQLPAGCDVALLKERLSVAHPDLAELLKRSAIAVNHIYADNRTLIAAGDEIAVIPPVAGG